MQYEAVYQREGSEDLSGVPVALFRVAEGENVGPMLTAWKQAVAAGGSREIIVRTIEVDEAMVYSEDADSHFTITGPAAPVPTPEPGSTADPEAVERGQIRARLVAEQRRRDLEEEVRAELESEGLIPSSHRFDTLEPLRTMPLSEPSTEPQMPTPGTPAEGDENVTVVNAPEPATGSEESGGDAEAATEESPGSLSDALSGADSVPAADGDTDADTRTTGRGRNR